MNDYDIQIDRINRAHGDDLAQPRDRGDEAIAIDRERAKTDPRYAAHTTAVNATVQQVVEWSRVVNLLVTEAADIRRRIRLQQPPDAVPLWERLLAGLQPEIAIAEAAHKSAHERMREMKRHSEGLVSQIVEGK